MAHGLVSLLGLQGPGSKRDSGREVTEEDILASISGLYMMQGENSFVYKEGRAREEDS